MGEGTGTDTVPTAKWIYLEKRFLILSHMLPSDTLTLSETLGQEMGREGEKEAQNQQKHEAMPSFLPVNPRCSVVVAFTEMFSTSKFITEARVSLI